jgi:hypothetical protein
LSLTPRFEFCYEILHARGGEIALNLGAIIKHSNESK